MSNIPVSALLQHVEEKLATHTLDAVAALDRTSIALAGRDRRRRATTWGGSGDSKDSQGGDNCEFGEHCELCCS